MILLRQETSLTTDTQIHLYHREIIYEKTDTDKSTLRSNHLSLKKRPDTIV